MKPRMMLVLGFAAGVIAASAVLMLWSSREQVRLEVELSALQRTLSDVEQAARRDRERLRNVREELSGIRERGPVIAPTAPPAVASATPPPAAPPSHNDAILGYLGEPVAPPADLDPKYSAEGLTATFKELCAAHGIEIDKLGVDTSEYPFLLYGKLTNGSEFFRQIDKELKTIPGYAYSGSVTNRPNDGSITFSLSMVPRKAYPREMAENIQRREMIRLQMLGSAWEPVR